MPQSIYDNGGMVGATLDFGDTEQYVLGTTQERLAPVYVGGKTVGRLGGTATLSIPLTDLSGGIGSAPAVGDVVVVAYAIGSNTQVPSGEFGIETFNYTRLAVLFRSDTNDINLDVSYKVMGDGFFGPGTTDADTAVIVSGTDNSAYAGAIAIHVWRGVDPLTPMDVTATTATLGNSRIPNPPAITTATANAVVLAIGAAGHTGGSLAFTSSLDNFISRGANDTYDATVGIGSITTTTPGTVDPAAFSIATSTTDAAAAVTLALRPALQDVPIYGNFKNSGIWSLNAVLEAAPGPPITFNFVDSATGRSSVTVPNSALAGDLAILVTAGFDDNVDLVFPSDFTQVRANDDDGDDTIVSGWKVLASEDIGATKQGINAEEDGMVLLVFRPNYPILNVAVSSINGEAGSLAPATQTLAMSGGTTPLIGVAFRSANNGINLSENIITTPDILTNIAVDNGVTNGLVASYIVYNPGSTPVDISVGMTDRGNNLMQSWVVTATNG
jgi:hypothetical protein